MDVGRSDCRVLAGDPDPEGTQTRLPSDEKNAEVVHDVTENPLTSSQTCNEPSEEEERTTDRDGVPYDRGWAWMVLLGHVINYFLLSGYIRSSGVIFVELLQRFQAPTSHTALLFSVRGAVFSIAGLFVMNVVVDRLGCRKTVLIGALLMSFSAILSSFANNLTLLICLQGVLLGLADPMLSSPGDVLTAVYFRRKRPLALAIAKSGASLGSMSYPPLLTLLLSRYGLHGALLLTGAISLHSLPAALLLRPLSYFRACANRWSHGNCGEMDSVDKKLPGKVASSAGDDRCNEKGSLRKASISGSCGDLVAVPSAAKMCVSGKTFTSTEASEDLENDSSHVHICTSEKTIPSAECFKDERKASSSHEMRLCDKKDFSIELDPGTKLVSDNRVTDVPKSLEACGDSTRTNYVESPILSIYSKAKWCKSTEEKYTDARHVKNVCDGDVDTHTDTQIPLADWSTNNCAETPALPLQCKSKRPVSNDESCSQNTKHVNGVCDENGEPGTQKVPLEFEQFCSETDTTLPSEHYQIVTEAVGRHCPDDRRSQLLLESFDSEHFDRTAIGEDCTAIYVTQHQQLQAVSGESVTLLKHDSHKTTSHQNKLSAVRRICSKLSVLDLSLLARPSFRVLLLYFMLSQTVTVPLDYLPALVKQNQLPKHRAAQLLSIIGGVDFVGRLLSGFLAHLKVSMVPVMLMSSLATLGVMYQLVRFLTTFPLLACLAVVQGLLAGVVRSMLPVLIVHVVGVKDMGKGIGFQYLVEGMFLASYHPLLGYIKDATQSYVTVYHVIGLGFLTAAALLGIEEILRRRETKAHRLSEGSKPDAVLR